MECVRFIAACVPGMGLNSQYEKKLSELMRATVAKPQVRAREGEDERSGRPKCDHRNTNWQRGRVRAASVQANTKPEAHQRRIK